MKLLEDLFKDVTYAVSERVRNPFWFSFVFCFIYFNKSNIAIFWSIGDIKSIDERKEALGGIDIVFLEPLAWAFLGFIVFYLIQLLSMTIAILFQERIKPNIHELLRSKQVAMAGRVTELKGIIDDYKRKVDDLQDENISLRRKVTEIQDDYNKLSAKAPDSEVFDEDFEALFNRSLKEDEKDKPAENSEVKERSETDDLFPFDIINKNPHYEHRLYEYLEMNFYRRWLEEYSYITVSKVYHEFRLTLSSSFKERLEMLVDDPGGFLIILNGAEDVDYNEIMDFVLKTVEKFGNEEVFMVSSIDGLLPNEIYRFLSKPKNRIIFRDNTKVAVKSYINELLSNLKEKSIGLEEFVVSFTPSTHSNNPRFYREHNGLRIARISEQKGLIVDWFRDLFMNYKDLELRLRELLLDRNDMISRFYEEFGYYINAPKLIEFVANLTVETYQLSIKKEE